MNYLYFTIHCAAAVLILLVCRVLPVSHRAQSITWKLLLIRFLLPFAKVPSPVSVFNWLAPKYERPLIYAEYTGEGVVVNPASVAAVRSMSVFPLLMWIGLGTAALVFAVIALRGFLLVRGSVPFEDPSGKAWLEGVPIKAELRCTGKIASPMSCGILGKRYLLAPEGFWFTERTRGVFEHELFHLKAHDTLWKALSLLMLCVHWFNPVVWVFYWYIQTEIELLCDEKVLNAHPPEYREEYAWLLVDLPVEERAAGVPVLSKFHSVRLLKKRIRSVMKHKRRSSVQWITSAAVSVLAVVSLSTNSIVYAAGRQPLEPEGFASSRVSPVHSESRSSVPHTPPERKAAYVPMSHGKAYQHDIKNGGFVIYNNGGTGWHFEKGQKAVICFLITDRPDITVGQMIDLGFICGGQKTIMIREQIKCGVELSFTAPEAGEYEFYVEAYTTEAILAETFTVKQ